jgi:ABC-2 type transport system permease protein
VGSVFRTPEQAGSIGPIAGIAMGMLAGCMWPRFIMPVPMQRLGQLFPQSWAMDAWIKLIADHAGLGGILPQLAVLGAFAVVLLPLSTWRLRRSIVH